MTSGRLLNPLVILALVGAGGFAALVALGLWPLGPATTWALLVVPTGLAGAAYVLWHADPAYTMSAGVACSCLTGNWPQLGVPGAMAPDRWLLLAGTVAALMKAPGIADRPRIRIRAVHFVLACLVVYAAFSGLAAGTLFTSGGFFKLVERMGVVPFVVFLVAPVVFRTEAQRRVLLSTLVAIGGYLGSTAIFQTVGLHALVWPQYIVDPTMPDFNGRAQGVFLEPVTNGSAMFVCAVAAAIVAASSRGGLAKNFSSLVVLVCVAGMFMTLERSIWIGAVVGIVAGLVFARSWRLLLGSAVAAALVIGLSLVAVPGLAERAEARRENASTIWDRQNLAHAAVNMVRARPLTGFGWNTFRESSIPYFEQNSNHPLTGAGFIVHNALLTYASELGLLGAGLWILALLMGVLGAIIRRGPPELQPWRAGLVAIAAFNVVVANAVFPQTFVTLTLWLWAGVLWSAPAFPVRDGRWSVGGRP